MKRALKFIAAFLFLASTSGLLLSMAHYHSKTMECLDHSPTEQHYSENTVLCPVSSIVTDHPENNVPVINDILTFAEIIELPIAAPVVADIQFNFFSRPPPAIA